MKNETKYTVDYFINKFSVIPEDEWTTASLSEFNDDGLECHCALGHCGLTSMHPDTYNEEALALSKLVWEGIRNPVTARMLDMHSAVWVVNDDHNTFGNLGETPKERIIGYLNQLKDGKMVEPDTRYGDDSVYV